MPRAWTTATKMVGQDLHLKLDLDNWYDRINVRYDLYAVDANGRTIARLINDAIVRVDPSSSGHAGLTITPPPTINNFSCHRKIAVTRSYLHLLKSDPPQQGTQE